MVDYFTNYIVSQGHKYFKKEVMLCLIVVDELKKIMQNGNITNAKTRKLL